MRIYFLFFLLFSSVFFSVQAQKKSELIFQEISKLSLRNNRLIVEAFLDNHPDSTFAISIFKLGKEKVKQFIREQPDLAILEDSVTLVNSQMDSIRNGYGKFKSLESAYDSADLNKKNGLRPQFMRLHRELGTKEPIYSVLFHTMEILRAQINRTALLRMLMKYQSNGDILPLHFIPSDELSQINEKLEIKRNKIVIEELYKRYKALVAAEIKTLY